MRKIIIFFIDYTLQYAVIMATDNLYVNFFTRRQSRRKAAFCCLARTTEKKKKVIGEISGRKRWRVFFLFFLPPAPLSRAGSLSFSCGPVHSNQIINFASVWILLLLKSNGPWGGEGFDAGSALTYCRGRGRRARTALAEEITNIKEATGLINSVIIFSEGEWTLCVRG